MNAPLFIVFLFAVYFVSLSFVLRRSVTFSKESSKHNEIFGAIGAMGTICGLAILGFVTATYGLIACITMLLSSLILGTLVYLIEKIFRISISILSIIGSALMLISGFWVQIHCFSVMS